MVSSVHIASRKQQKEETSITARFAKRTSAQPVSEDPNSYASESCSRSGTTSESEWGSASEHSNSSCGIDEDELDDQMDWTADDGSVPPVSALHPSKYVTSPVAEDEPCRPPEASSSREQPPAVPIEPTKVIKTIVQRRLTVTPRPARAGPSTPVRRVYENYDDDSDVEMRVKGELASDYDELESEDESPEREPVQVCTPPPRHRRYSFQPYPVQNTTRSPRTPVSRAPSSRDSLTPLSPHAPRTPARPRHKQVMLHGKEFERALHQAINSPALVCPVPSCPYVQKIRRMPDMRRHVETHRAQANYEKWICCGVPLRDAAKYKITNVSQAYEFKGTEMVGGCLKGFSRRDALVRHLKSDRNTCVGEARLLHLLHGGDCMQT